MRKDASHRVCPDPRRINDNLKRCPHKHANSRITYPRVCRHKRILKDGRKCRLLVYPPRLGQRGDHNFREVLLQEATIWLVRVPRAIPTGHGPNPSKSTRLCRYRRPVIRGVRGFVRIPLFANPLYKNTNPPPTTNFPTAYLTSNSKHVHLRCIYSDSAYIADLLGLSSNLSPNPLQYSIRTTHSVQSLEHPQSA